MIRFTVSQMKRALKIALLKRGCGKQLSNWLGNVISKHADDLTRQFHVQIWNTFNRCWVVDRPTQRAASNRGNCMSQLLRVIGLYTGQRTTTYGRGQVRRYKDERVLKNEREPATKGKIKRNPVWRWESTQFHCSIDAELERRKLSLQEGIENCG